MLWNQKDLPQPPINTYKTLVGTLDLTKLRNALQDGIKHFKNDDFLSNETLILSRILYRMKTKFRSSKDFKLMEKLCRSLNIYFSVNLGRHLKTILEMTPKSYRNDTYLPTRNMLDFILVRLQGLAKLMEKIYDTCLIIASELNQRVFIGHFWKLFLILFALVSRISILVKFNTKFICDLYGKLLPNSYKLQNTGKNWLPEGYVLPPDLRAWMSVKWVYEDEFVDLTFEPENEIINFFNLVQNDEDDDVVFCDEYILLDEEDRHIMNDFNKLSPIKETLTRNRMRGFSINEDDIGEEIDDKIELNASVDPINAIEENADDQFHSSNRSSQIEDIGEDISCPKAIPTSHGKKIDEKENMENLVDENFIFSVPSIPIGKQELTEDSDIIILDDTIKKESNKKKKPVSKKKPQDSTYKTITNNNTNKTQIPQPTAHIHTKRKLEFDGNISNKKLKTKEKATLIQNEIVLKSPKELKSKKKTKLGKKKRTTELHSNLPHQDSDTEESIIFLNQEAAPKTKRANSILQDRNLKLNKIIPEPLASTKRQKTLTNIGNFETSNSHNRSNSDSSIIFLNQEDTAESMLGKGNKNKKKVKKLKKNKQVEASIMFLDEDVSFTKSNGITPPASRKKSKLTKKKKNLEQHTNKNSNNKIGLDSDNTLFDFVPLKKNKKLARKKKSKRSFGTKKSNALKNVVKKSPVRKKGRKSTYATTTYKNFVHSLVQYL